MHQPAAAAQAGFPEQDNQTLPCAGKMIKKMMQIQDEISKNKLIARLKRIEGQVRGVQTMLDEERDCREIMQQLTAIHSAVQSTSRVFFRDYAAICLAEMEGDMEEGASVSLEKRNQMVQDMIDLLDKTP